MSKEFIEKAYNYKDITDASTQQDQLSYFIDSKIQDNRTDGDYISKWANRKYQTDDYFLNWIKIIFRTTNFLSFFKYLRYPLPSSKIIHNRIEPQLRRVFNAEDSDFKYDVSNKVLSDFEEDLNIKEFNNNIFKELLYRHNSILIADLSPTEKNKPYRYFLDIKNVVSIECTNKINKIAFTGSIKHEGKKIVGYIYIDDDKYQFYDNKYELIAESPHDLGYCPAHFISSNRMGGSFIIRESLFTYIREEIEEYVFLKTLLKMTEPNGAIPITTKIQAKVNKEEKISGFGEPTIDNAMSSQQAQIYNQNDNNSDGDLQAGTIHEVTIKSIQDNEGKINMDAVKNYLNFFYIPVEILEYINTRIKEIEKSIVSTIVGDFLEGNESAKNERQIEKSISILENTLRSFADSLNRIRRLSDLDILNLKYGKQLVNDIFIYYGTDFFLDSQTKLFEDLEKAPNTLERKNIIVRINQNRYKNNQDQYSRTKLLYDLIPYVSDKDFEFAGDIDPIIKEYQLRFTYWIAQFEANFGDITQYYNNLDLVTSQKLVVINNLIIELIKKQSNEKVNSRINEEN